LSNYHFVYRKSQIDLTGIETESPRSATSRLSHGTT